MAMNNPATRNLDTNAFIKSIRNHRDIWDRAYQSNKFQTDQSWSRISDRFSLAKPVLKAKWKALRDGFRIEYKKIPRNEFDQLLINPADFDSTWAYYKPLIFLAGHMRSRPKPNDSSDISYQDDPYSYQVNADYYKYDPSFDDDIDDIIEIPDVDPMDVPSNVIAINGTHYNVGELETPERKPKKVKLESSATGSTSTYTPVSTPASAAGPSVPIKKNGSSSSVDEALAVDNTDDDYHFLMSLHPFMGQLTNAQKLRVRMRFNKILFKELFKDEGDSD